MKFCVAHIAPILRFFHIFFSRRLLVKKYANASAQMWHRPREVIKLRTKIIITKRHGLLMMATITGFYVSCLCEQLFKYWPMSLVARYLSTACFWWANVVRRNNSDSQEIKLEYQTKIYFQEKLFYRSFDIAHNLHIRWTKFVILKLVLLSLTNFMFINGISGKLIFTKHSTRIIEKKKSGKNMFVHNRNLPRNVSVHSSRNERTKKKISPKSTFSMCGNN